MVDKIYVITRKKFMFKQADFDPLKDNLVIGERNPGKHFNGKVVYTEPGALGAYGNIQELPAWVKEDPIYGWGVQDGDIMEVVPPKGKLNAEEAAVQSAQAQAQNVLERSAAAPLPDLPPEEVERLNKMNKQKLLAHAVELGVAVDPTLTPPEIRDALIEEKRAKLAAGE